ncbi:hypothetical protein D9611_009517 [Ephemerocybe angulata]|uniref:Uncharacterized protein n=1 Tax=Ephemerocybe angulata TaxID=980116 RepID=A0A8H5ET94_9AGAR|nr:hypothetical protein D9611_009517 [Tulosesus angulatus]
MIKTALIFSVTTLLSFGVIPAAAHVGAYGPGMYCRLGNEGIDNNNANDVSQPLYNLTKKDWWMHHENRIDQFPPAAGDFLELRAGGYVTLELAVNRAFTTTSGNPILGEFPNGQNEIFPSGRSQEGCVTEPNLHTKSEAEAAGTVLAISYANTLDGVSSDNLGVISVAYNTPWRRLVNYSLPMMPTCSDAGCHCAWGWVPTGCGRPDMYMQPFKCKVTNGFSIFGPPTFKPAKALPPVWCQDDPSKCIVGPKQMIYYNQLDGNNVNLTGVDDAGNPKKPAYDMRYGWADGAQWDYVPYAKIPQDKRQYVPAWYAAGSRYAPAPAGKVRSRRWP